MILRSTRNNGLLATLFAGLISFSVGCIIVGGNGNGDGPNDCGSLLDNNYIGNDGFCYCEQNHAWCNPNDDLDLSCCEIDPMDPVDGTCGNNSYLADDGLCYCEQDYDWCSNTGLDCCPLDPKDPTAWLYSALLARAALLVFLIVVGLPLLALFLVALFLATIVFAVLAGVNFVLLKIRGILPRNDGRENVRVIQRR